MGVQVLKDLFGVSQSVATETFNQVICVIMVSCLYNEFLYLPRSDDEWRTDCKLFIENYKFPCVGAWDGFYVHGATTLRYYYSFKNKYTISSMGLIGHNKRFLHLTTGAPGITHDARLLRHATLFRHIENDVAIPNKTIDLGEAGEIPFVTLDSAFPRLPWMIKGFKENTRDPKERYFNKKLCSARVVTENAYGTLKGCWRLIYTKCECKLHNMKDIIMAAVLLHNLCIHTNDPCKRWKISVENLEFTDKSVCRKESRNTKFISQEISQKICDWLWSQQ